MRVGGGGSRQRERCKKDSGGGNCLGHMLGAPTGLVLGQHQLSGRSRGQDQRGGQGSEGDRLGHRAVELGPLLCNSRCGTGHLEGEDGLDRTGLEGREQLAAQSPFPPRHTWSLSLFCHQWAFVK